MTADEILLEAEEKMEKAVVKLKRDLTGIRTGRANPGLVDSLKVEAYGSPIPMKQIAAVSTPEPAQILIRPYDPGTLKDIEKSILASDLGFTPQSDGRVIRLNIPPLSREMRQRMVGRVRDLCEEAKVAIRNIRRNSNKAADQAEKDKALSEDERDEVKNEVQELTKKYENDANDLAGAREKEVLED
jgi:ribosome recycling factor